MGLAKMLKILNRMFTKGDKAGAAEFSWSTMYVGGMHFQDNYNYDIERVKRCVIHYATPDGKVIPFCAYNTGPNFREEIEKKFAVPIEEWRGGRGRAGRLDSPPPPPPPQHGGRRQPLPPPRGPPRRAPHHTPPPRPGPPCPPRRTHAVRHV